MADTKALGVGPDLNIVILEEDPTDVNISIFKKESEVWIEKETFDPYTAEFKKTKGVKFTLSGYTIGKQKNKTYYIFSKAAYKQISTLLKLPKLSSLKGK